MNIAHWLARSARINPQAPAIAHGHTLWCNYAEFAQRTARTSAWLTQQGIAPGDRVALFMANRPEYLALLWGAWWHGAVAVPINAKLHPREAAWIMSHSGCRLAWCGEDVGDEVANEASPVTTVHTQFDFLRDESLPEPAVTPRTDTDPAWLFYTSGTTGRPKGVTLAARQLRGSTLGFLASIQSVAPGDCMLHPAPLSHGGGMYHLPYVLNAALNVVPQSGGFDGAECLALARHWQRASFFAAPIMVRRLVDAAKRLGHTPNAPQAASTSDTAAATPDAASTGLANTGLATIIYGGGPMYLADIEDAMATLGGHFAQIYGQGECPMTITVLAKEMLNTAARQRQAVPSSLAANGAANWVEIGASVGVAQSMVEVSVRDAQGTELPIGTPGEVCVKGEVVMEGYWRDPAATARAIRNGWLYTGDIGRLDAAGYLTLLDRSKDLIISGGSNIYPREVEEALLTHPSVAEAAVIGRPDPEWGEIVVAFVVIKGEQNCESRVASHSETNDDPTSKHLDAHCLAHIARFKRPKHYHFVSELPKNNYGKVLKGTLREVDGGRGQCH
jgi:long-chain acyl-CoA synthetase